MFEFPGTTYKFEYAILEISYVDLLSSQEKLERAVSFLHPFFPSGAV